MWPTLIVEVEPVGATGGSIVWEWHAWDHLVQDFDAGRPNFGVVADHPELVDLNHVANVSSDWIHANGIDYDPVLDQIVVSVRTTLNKPFPRIEALTPHYYAADFIEREIFDFLGVEFVGHPDLRKILSSHDRPADFHPMRRDE